MPRFDGFDDQVAQPRAGRNLDFQLVGPVFELLGRHLFVGLDAGLALGLPGLGRRADPFQLAGERLLPGGGLLLFDGQPASLLLEPGRVVAFQGNGPAVVELQNPLGHVVEEVAIVRHGDDGAGVLGQMPLEPGDALGVEMVRRLVEQQQVGLLAAAACTARRGASRRRRAFVTSASPGGRFIASIAISTCRSSSQALHVLDLVLHAWPGGRAAFPFRRGRSPRRACRRAARTR